MEVPDEYPTPENLDEYFSGVSALILGIEVFKMNINKAVRYYQDASMHEALTAVLELKYSFENLDIQANIDYINDVVCKMRERLSNGIQ